MCVVLLQIILFSIVAVATSSAGGVTPVVGHSVLSSHSSVIAHPAPVVKAVPAVHAAHVVPVKTVHIVPVVKTAAVVVHHH